MEKRRTDIVSRPNKRIERGKGEKEMIFSSGLNDSTKNTNNPVYNKSN